MLRECVDFADVPVSTGIRLIVDNDGIQHEGGEHCGIHRKFSLSLEHGRLALFMSMFAIDGYGSECEYEGIVYPCYDSVREDELCEFIREVPTCGVCEYEFLEGAVFEHGRILIATGEEERMPYAMAPLGQVMGRWTSFFADSFSLPGHRLNTEARRLVLERFSRGSLDLRMPILSLLELTTNKVYEDACPYVDDRTETFRRMCRRARDMRWGECLLFLRKVEQCLKQFEWSLSDIDECRCESLLFGAVPGRIWDEFVDELEEEARAIRKHVVDCCDLHSVLED